MLKLARETRRGHAPRTRGQALVEAGLLMPLLVFMLMVVGFMGLAILERQNVLIAARFAARQASLDALATSADKLALTGVLREAGASQARLDAARKVLGSKRSLTLNAPEWGKAEVLALRGKLMPVPLPGNMARAYIARDPSKRFGLGFVMYGQKLTSKGPWLEEAGKSANEAAKLISSKPGKLWEGVGMQGEAFMPSELPLRGPGLGVLDMNPWIAQAMSLPVPP